MIALMQTKQGKNPFLCTLYVSGSTDFDMPFSKHEISVQLQFQKPEATKSTNPLLMKQDLCFFSIRIQIRKKEPVAP